MLFFIVHTGHPIIVLELWVRIPLMARRTRYNVMW